MPIYQYPGVYVEEVGPGPRPIEGVPTSTAGLLGETERGALTPRLITSAREYAQWYGQPFDAGKFLPHAVRSFFDNGGRRAVIFRLVSGDATTAEAVFGDVIIRAAGPGAWGSRVFVKVSDSTTKNAGGNPIGFRLQVAYWSHDVPDGDPFAEDGRLALPPPTIVEDFDDIDPDGPDGALVVSGRSALVVLVGAEGVAAAARPANGATRLAGGAGGAEVLTEDDYRGQPSGHRSVRQGLAALDAVPEGDSTSDASWAHRDVSLVYAPAVSPAIAKALVTHCEEQFFRFAIIDGDRGVTDPGALDPRGTIAVGSRAAFYWPWIAIADPRTGIRTLVPPGGSVLGIYARVDTERGVFKAPANEVVRGALGLEHDITDRVQDELNPKGVNVIRTFSGRGILVWGARTLSSDPQWTYVSVRRLFIYLERSIVEGTQWVVFEPNNERLWARVRDTIRQFLRTEWRMGALQGRSEDEAFFVTCDRTTMTQGDILNGRLVAEVGVATVRPAEFVIFRICRHTAEASA